MNKSRTMLALCLVSLLGACVQMPAGKPATLSYQSSNTTLLEDAERIFALPAEAQEKELTLINQANASHDNQLKAVMVYTLVNSRYCGSTLAVPAPAAATIADDDAAREKKWDKERKALTKQLKESVEENQKLAQKAHDEQARADNLQEKLDELKNIEKTMGSREQGTRK